MMVYLNHHMIHRDMDLMRYVRVADSNLVMMITQIRSRELGIGKRNG